MRRSYRIGLAVVTLAVFAHPATAQIVATGPYYATPSWDQTFPGSTRFVVLANFNNEAVLDRETGLVWERSPTLGFLAWTASSQHCLDQQTGTRGGWRLPTINELASLFDPSATAAPALPSGHPFAGFPENGQTVFPSSTPSDPQDPLLHRSVSYIVSGGFDLMTVFNATLANAILCVRSGLNANPQ
jgi:hypothetical protein